MEASTQSQDSEQQTEMAGLYECGRIPLTAPDGTVYNRGQVVPDCEEWETFNALLRGNYLVPRNMGEKRRETQARQTQRSLSILDDTLKEVQRRAQVAHEQREAKKAEELERKNSRPLASTVAGVGDTVTDDDGVEVEADDPSLATGASTGVSSAPAGGDDLEGVHVSEISIPQLKEHVQGLGLEGVQDLLIQEETSEVVRKGAVDVLKRRMQELEAKED